MKVVVGQRLKELGNVLGRYLPGLVFALSFHHLRHRVAAGMGVEAAFAPVAHLSHLALIQVHEELDGVAALPGLPTATIRTVDVAAPVASEGHLQKLHGVLRAELLKKLDLRLGFHDFRRIMPLSRGYTRATNGFFVKITTYCYFAAVTTESRL
jgi:hypothetical protein